MPDVSALRLVLLSLAGWVHREQAATIAFLIEENRVLKEQLRIRHTASAALLGHDAIELTETGRATIR